MNTLVAIEYDDPFKAEEMRLKFLKMQRKSIWWILRMPW
jgi:uncharacterized membrane protein